MDNAGWVKFYRKAKENGILKDHKAWALFSWILLSVDRHTGKYTTGRFMLAEAVGMDESTVYKVLKRLEKKWKVVTLSSNNKYTEISLIHWDIYNPASETVTQSGSTKVTTKEQQSNTKQEVEKKEVEKYNTGKSPEIAKTEEIPEHHPTTGDLPKGMNSLGSIFRDRFSGGIPKPEAKNGTGITKPWQEKAFRYAKELNIKLSDAVKPRWLKIFKQAAEGRKPGNIDRAYSYLVDYPGNLTDEAKLNYFFYIYENGLKPNWSP